MSGTNELWPEPTKGRYMAEISKLFPNYRIYVKYLKLWNKPVEYEKCMLTLTIKTQYQ